MENSFALERSLDQNERRERFFSGSVRRKKVEVKKFFSCFSLIALLALAGCGGGSITTPPVTRVHLTVTVNGSTASSFEGDSESTDPVDLVSIITTMLQGSPALAPGARVDGTIETRFVGVTNLTTSIFTTSAAPDGSLTSQLLAGIQNAIYNNKGGPMSSVDIGLTVK